MKNVLLSVYTDMILSLHTGSVNGNVAVSKPIYIITIIEAIESGVLKDNRIDLDNCTNKLMETEKDTKVHFLLDHISILIVPLSTI